MKKIILTAIALMSFQTFAFTSVTLKKDITLLKKDQGLALSLSTGKGNEYCHVSFSSIENADSLVVKAGAVFEVTELIQNGCGQDWGRQCRLDLSANSQEKGVQLYLTCKDRGMFAKKFTPQKVISVTKFLSVK